ncbi:dienelactone hydrolase [Arthrobacter sp. MYb224]|uniref:dienelactone hydrolase family protein n=1 Tax=Arthrobacter sp. MYb224 TaxID=1848600 RepID=UPI000CFC53CA|nr:alpha/beta fold hydrolase [Arthrobacter sp. MYb224]PQZ98920.1 dienelactone hydrolase [Arthrobacter sp. MYb224]
MAEIVLFHHVQGLTPGVRAMAEELETAGHKVHTLDLYGGAQPESVEAGLQLANSISEAEINQQVSALLDSLPPKLVYVGTSWGASLAQRYAQQRPGALAAVLLESFVDLDADWGFGPWPESVKAQIHGKDADPFFALEGDLGAAQDFVAGPGNGIAELYTYAGNQHLFTDSSLSSCDPKARSLVMERVLGFLAPWV